MAPTFVCYSHNLSLLINIPLRFVDNTVISGVEVEILKLLYTWCIHCYTLELYTWVTHLSYTLELYTWVIHLSYTLELYTWVIHLSYTLELYTWVIHLSYTPWVIHLSYTPELYTWVIHLSYILSYTLELHTWVIHLSYTLELYTWVIHLSYTLDYLLYHYPAMFNKMVLAGVLENFFEWHGKIEDKLWTLFDKKGDWVTYALGFPIKHCFFIGISYTPPFITVIYASTLRNCNQFSMRFH